MYQHIQSKYHQSSHKLDHYTVYHLIKTLTSLIKTSLSIISESKVNILTLSKAVHASIVKKVSLDKIVNNILHSKYVLALPITLKKNHIAAHINSKNYLHF